MPAYLGKLLYQLVLLNLCGIIKNYGGCSKYFINVHLDFGRRNTLDLPGNEPPSVAMLSLLNAYIAAEATETVFTSSSNWGRFIVETKKSRGKTKVIVDLDNKHYGGAGAHHRYHLL